MMHSNPLRICKIPLRRVKKPGSLVTIISLGQYIPTQERDIGRHAVHVDRHALTIHNCFHGTHTIVTGDVKQIINKAQRLSLPQIHPHQAKI